MCLECACQVTHDDCFLFSYVLFDCLYGRARIARRMVSSVNWHYPVDTKSAYVVSLYLIFSLLTITISSLAPKLKRAAECRQPAAISDSLLWRVGSTNPWTAARTGGSTGQAAEAWGLLLGMDWTRSKSNWILAHGFKWIWTWLDMDIHLLI